MAISQELLEILACPKCKGNIRLNDAQNGLICDNCKLVYEIKDELCSFWKPRLAQHRNHTIYVSFVLKS